MAETDPKPVPPTPPQPRCQVPQPPGWTCTRAAGHEGPCASVPPSSPTPAPEPPTPKPKINGSTIQSMVVLSVIALGCFIAGTYVCSSRDKKDDDIVVVKLPLSLPKKVLAPVGKGVVKIEATTLKAGTGKVRWVPYPGLDGKLQIIPYPDHAQVYSIAPGLYYVGADLENDASPVQWTLVDATETPSPIPPGPTPDPNKPSPFKAQGLRFYFLYDKEAKLPTEQYAAIFGSDSRTWYDSVAAKGPDGKTPEWRVLPAKTEVSKSMPKIWQDALSLPYVELPWLVVGNSKTGYTGKVPTTVDETKKLIQQFQE